MIEYYAHTHSLISIHKKIAKQFKNNFQHFHFIYIREQIYPDGNIHIFILK
jgi:hypothetical protein